MTDQKQDTDFIALKHFTKANAEFEIGGKKYVMKPLVISKIRELVELLEKSGTELQDFKDLKSFNTFLLDKISQLFPIVFNDKIEKSFADDNISLPLCREIFDTFIKINRLEDILPFFVKEMSRRVTVKIKE